jgi:hypothetical protein
MDTPKHLKAMAAPKNTASWVMTRSEARGMGGGGVKEAKGQKKLRQERRGPCCVNSDFDRGIKRGRRIGR